MDFEEKSKAYMESKKSIEKAKQELEQLRAEFADVVKRKEQAKKEKDKAKNAKDKKAEKLADKKLKKIEEEYSEIEEKLLNKRNEVQSYEALIDSAIKEVGQDPAIRQEIDKELGKQYDKQLTKLQSALKEDEKNKTKNRTNSAALNELLEIVKTDPESAKNLTEYIEQRKQYTDLNKEYELLMEKEHKTEKDNKRIVEILTKIKKIEKPMEKSKNDILSFVEKKGLTFVTKDNLDELVQITIEGRLETDKSGKLDIAKTLQSNIKDIDKKVENIDKQIEKKMKRMKAYSFAKGELETTDPTPRTPASTEKPKWYQFGKRFTEWRNNRKRDKLPAPTEPTTEITDDVLISELFAKARDQRRSQVDDQRKAFMEAIDCREKAAEIAKRAQEEVDRLNAKAEKAEKAAGITK